MKSQNQDLQHLFHRALRRIRQGAFVTIQGAALTSALLSGPAGCTDEAPATDDDTVDPQGPGGKGDWAQGEGERNTTMVSFTGDAWSECRETSSRTGCYAYEAFLKVLIKPVADVSPTAKKVGVVYRSVESYLGPERTANGTYFSTRPDGLEEWHVPVRVLTYEDLFKFNVWYQPGNNKTYYDDNNGELHVFTNNNATQVIQAAPWESSVKVVDGRVVGKVRVRVADIDNDKIVGMHCTVNGWTNVLEFGTGNGGDKNKFYWVEDTWGNNEYWEIDLDVAAPGVTEFRYAVYYEHGVVNDAKRTRYWDNAGGSDYRVVRGSGGSRG